MPYLILAWASGNAGDGKQSPYKQAKEGHQRYFSSTRTQSVAFLLFTPGVVKM